MTNKVTRELMDPPTFGLGDFDKSAVGAWIPVAPVAGVLTIDYDAGQRFRVNHNANISQIIFQNAVAGWPIWLCFVESGAGRTITWPSHVKGTIPAHTATSGAKSIYMFSYLDTGSPEESYVVQERTFA